MNTTTILEVHVPEDSLLDWKAIHNKTVMLIRADYCQSGKEHVAMVQHGLRFYTIPTAWCMVHVPQTEAANDTPVE